MKRKAITTMLALVALVQANAAKEPFDSVFENRTLQLDYIYAGDDKATAIYFDECGVTDVWAGRRCHLDRPFLKGNGGIWVLDPVTADTLYCNSFSTIFQEWQHTPEAQEVARSFESTLLVPFPRKPVDIVVEIYDNRGETVAQHRRRLDPADIQIRRMPNTLAETRDIHRGGTAEECIDVVIVAEGYTEAEKKKFFADAERSVDAFLSHEPFDAMKDKFNFTAVATLSEDSGPDQPGKGVWNRTAHRSHYDTFYYERYLTTQAIHDLYASVAGVPFEHIIMIVNTPRYGGGGFFNQLTVSAADHPTFKEVLVHEFGHAYAGLADEYFYEGEEDSTYPLDIEPWEPNITTMVDFESKWADLMPDGTPIPTPLAEGVDTKTLDRDDPANAATLKMLSQKVGAYEGGGYRLKGVYRPVQECRMKGNLVDMFCPVCSRAVVDITNWYLGTE